MPKVEEVVGNLSYNKFIDVMNSFPEEEREEVFKTTIISTCSAYLHAVAEEHTVNLKTEERRLRYSLRLMMVGLPLWIALLVLGLINEASKIQ
jgi:hypothetical protein